jgi:hypothetical protein
MYVQELGLQIKKSVKHHCTIHYRKLTDCLECKQIVSGVINAENSIRLWRLKCGQFMALLDESDVSRVTSMVFKSAGLLTIGLCNVTVTTVLFCSAKTISGLARVALTRVAYLV